MLQITAVFILILLSINCSLKRLEVKGSKTKRRYKVVFIHQNSFEFNWLQFEARMYRWTREKFEEEALKRGLAYKDYLIHF